MEEEVTKRKQSYKVTIDQKILDDFDVKYAENCNQEKMRHKARFVGVENPFHPRNVPP